MMSAVENFKMYDTTIPIKHTPSPEIVISRTPTAVPGLEKQMDKEVEQVFRELDTNGNSQKQTFFQFRPMSTSNSAEKRRRRVPQNMTKSGGDAPGHTFKLDFPEIDLMRKGDSNYNTSSESLEDDARRQFYMESPTTGKRMYHMEFDVHGYDQDNISAKVSGSRLVVHAVQQETDNGRKSTTEFCRKVKLPSDVEIHKLQCTCINGTLIVEAPAPKLLLSGNGTPTFSTSSPKVEPLNKPLFKESPAGKFMNLTVELGKIFRADDVLVKLKSQNKLMVHAQREEEQDKSKLTATVTREFELDEKIIPQSLKAGLTADGLLKVSAQVMVEVRIIVNGLDEEDEKETEISGDSEIKTDKT